MCSFRITNHPVLEFSTPRHTVKFTFNGKEMTGHEGEPIIVALRASGVIKLREGAKHHTPYGPFCMQGRCCSCAMTVNKRPNVMTCVTPLEEGMEVQYQGSDLDTEIFKRLPTKRIDISASAFDQPHAQCDLAIIGAGPAGMEAAIMAAEAGVKSVVLFDDKSYLGGQLALQTHTFFGNEELGASIRGYEIANQMRQRIEKLPIDVRLNSTVIGVYPQNLVAFRDEDRLNFVSAKKLVFATGASERFLSFEGNYLPGVMGAGGAQTFMNVYGVRPGNRVVIIGGGNIGVILAYQLIQAGATVAAVAEAGPKMGAYGVHVNKIRALGVPLFTNHTVVRAHGSDCVTGATLVQVDAQFKPIAGTEKFFEADTICLAVGLSPLNELLWQTGIDFEFIPELGEVPKFDRYRQSSNSTIFVAGDCAAIGEASIARLEGRIAGLKAALDLGHSHRNFNTLIDEAFDLLRNIQTGQFGYRLGVGKARLTNEVVSENFTSQPVTQTLNASSFQGKEKKILIDCPQDIPCNPCEAACHLDAIKIGKQINQRPDVDLTKCKGCGLCITACPGRAIRVIQYNYDNGLSAITVPFEFGPLPAEGERVQLLNKEGRTVTEGKVIKARPAKNKTGCGDVTFTVDKRFAFDVVTVKLFEPVEPQLIPDPQTEEARRQTYVCRCEEVTYQDVLDLINQGHTSINEIKRLKRVGMGQCRGLSCSGVIEGILKRELEKRQGELLDVKRRRRTIFRPPIKRITLGEAAKLKFSSDEIQLFEGIEKVRTIPQEIVNTYIETENPPITKKSKSKIVIIGGGISGIFTAWHLAKLGETDVTIVEKDFLSSGKTGAALGGVRTGFNTRNKVLRARKGLEIYKNAKTLIGEDVGWFQGGYVYLGFDENQNRLFEQSAPIWESEGIDFYFTKETAEFNRFVPGIDDKRVTSLVHFPEDGGVNPFRAAFMFAQDCKKMGVKILTNSEAVKINLENNTVRSVQIFDHQNKTYHEIECEHLVNAAGTAAVKVAKMAGIDLSSQVWIERHGAFITEKMPLWLDPLVVSYHPTLSGYWQQKRMEENVREGEIVACYSPTQIIQGHNNHSYIYFLTRMAQAMLYCQPGLADVGIIRNFAEHYVGRKSGIPLIGPTPVKGFWLNMAKKGHGLMCAPGDGLALAQSILKGFGHRHEWISECSIVEDPTQQETMK